MINRFALKFFYAELGRNEMFEVMGLYNHNFSNLQKLNLFRQYLLCFYQKHPSLFLIQWTCPTITCLQLSYPAREFTDRASQKMSSAGRRSV